MLTIVSHFFAECNTERGIDCSLYRVFINSYISAKIRRPKQILIFVQKSNLHFYTV